MSKTNPDINGPVPFWRYTGSDIPNEIWNDVPSHHGLEASCFGRTRNKESGKIIRQCFNGMSRYLHLRWKDAVLYAHHVVSEAFLGRRPEGMLVVHFDDCSTNNVISNLRYGTGRDNALDHKFNTRPDVQRLDDAGRELLHAMGRMTDVEMLKVEAVLHAAWIAEHITAISET